MDTTNTITFTLVGEYLVDPERFAAALKENPPNNGQDPPTNPTFGAEYAGTFEIKMPTLGDHLAIRGYARAMGEKLGVTNIEAWHREDPVTAELVEALAFFALVATKKPAWCSAEAEEGDAMLAVIRAHQIARQRIADAKKKRAGASAGT